MTNCTKLFSICFAILLCLPIIGTSQVFKKVQSDGPDLKFDCINPANGIFTIDIGVLIYNQNLLRTDDIVHDVEPCDLQIGFHIAEINTTFYEPISNITPTPNNSNTGINGVISTTINGNLYDIPCSEEFLTVTMDIYCKNGEEYTPINLCTDRMDYSTILPMSQIRGCSVAETFEIKMCCEEGDVSAFRKKMRNINPKRIKLDVESNGYSFTLSGIERQENMNIEIFSITGQKVANTQFYDEGDQKVLVKNDNLSFGCYFVRISNGIEVETIKFIQF